MHGFNDIYTKLSLKKNDNKQTHKHTQTKLTNKETNKNKTVMAEQHGTVMLTVLYAIVNLVSVLVRTECSVYIDKTIEELTF